MSKPTPNVVTLVKQRDGLRCVRCGRYLMDFPASIHHRRLRSHPFPGLHLPSNLICLCGTGTEYCHGWVHAHPQESYEMGWLVRGSSDLLLPIQMPVLICDVGWKFLDDEGNYLDEMEKAA